MNEVNNYNKEQPVNNQNIGNQMPNGQMNYQNNNQPSNNNKSSNGLMVVIIILLLALIGVVVYAFILKPTDKKENKTTNNETINNEVVKDKDDTKEEKKIVVEDVTKDYKSHNGKQIVIYKLTDKNSYNYEQYTDDISVLDYSVVINSTKVGTFKCITNNCELKDADSKYALIDEKDGTISLYDYKKNILIVNFKTEITKENELSCSTLLLKDIKGSVYGFYVRYDKNGKYYIDIYSLLNKEIYQGIEGYESQAYVYGGKYTAVEDEDSDNDKVFDLTTGKFVKTLNGRLGNVIEIGNKTYLIINDNKSSNICDINGNVKISNLDEIYSESNKIVVSKNGKFYIYDSNLKLIKESKKYTEILKIDKDYVLVINDLKIQLIDFNDNVLATFVNDYSEDKYTIHTMLSGWYTDNGKNGIYIVVGVNDKNITYESVKKYVSDLTKESFNEMDKGYEYYYIPTTKETGKIPTVIGGYAKPVLYLYPTKKTNVTVNFENEDMLTTTYPKFNKEWSVTANPNGDLYDKNGNYYYALYWEENGNHRVDFNEGFYVEKENAIKFLEEKLEYIGLNNKEKNEFIMYWLPIIEKNEKNLIYFELTEERDSYNKLIIDPKPDSMLRIAIHVKKVNKKTNIKEQKLTKFNRKGFSAIEWGGVLYN